MLRLKSITKRFGDTTAVENINLDVDPGETTVLIGPSGCGKSTLLRIINGLVEPDTGEVEIDDTVLRPENIEELRHRTGYVIQEGGLFPHMTARKNVSLLARYLEWDTERIDTRVTELADLTHLSDKLLDRYPGELSGGQRQRISLIRALMLDPELLLLDEPLGALDPMIRAELQDELSDIFARLQKTVVLVTHDLAEAAHFGAHIVLMRSGKIVQRGDMEDLLERPAGEFVTEFVEAQR